MFRVLSVLRRFSTYETVKVDTIDSVQVITMSRAKELNPLSTKLARELPEACRAAEKNDAIRAIVITGSERVFSAGAGADDLLRIVNTGAHESDLFSDLDGLKLINKPLIAAVSGITFGGGALIAMLCDIVIASNIAKFALPELVIAFLPVFGGTQRMIKTIGKSRAMEMILTGETLSAREAFQRGLVNRIVPKEKVLEEAIAVAKKIAKFSSPVVTIAKESVHRSFETSLAEGLKFEQAAFRSTFCLEDRKEGMMAFIAKQQPNFQHK